MRQFDKLLLAVSLMAPLVIATLGLPKFVERVIAPAPRSSPVPAAATATPADLITNAAAGTPSGATSAASTISTAPQPTVRMATPETQRATSAAPTMSTPAAQPTVRVATAETQPALIPPEATRETAALPTAAEVRADDPVHAISRFYALVSSGEFGAAEELWSSRMRSRFPPQENIVHRFSHTHVIGLQRANVVAQSPSQATVAADVLETDSRGAFRHFVGRWHLVRGAQGWLLDRPELEAVP